MSDSTQTFKTGDFCTVSGENGKEYSGQIIGLNAHGKFDVMCNGLFMGIEPEKLKPIKVDKLFELNRTVHESIINLMSYLKLAKSLFNSPDKEERMKSVKSGLEFAEEDWHKIKHILNQEVSYAEESEEE